MVKFFISEKEGEWNLIDTETGKQSPPLKEDFKRLVKVYVENKPLLKSKDVYELILCNLAIANLDITGVLHYKKNGKNELVTINK